jgi:hypothetical protein
VNHAPASSAGSSVETIFLMHLDRRAVYLCGGNLTNTKFLDNLFRNFLPNCRDSFLHAFIERRFPLLKRSVCHVGLALSEPDFEGLFQHGCHFLFLLADASVFFPCSLFNFLIDPPARVLSIAKK